MPDYKAVPYKKNKIYEPDAEDIALLGELLPTYSRMEMRWAIVDEKTGEVLDDAQGYGYKSAQKAYAAYAYKQRGKNQNKKKKEQNRKSTKEIQNWLKEHKDFSDEMLYYSVEIAKGRYGPDKEFNAAAVQELLNAYKLEPDFTPGQILKVWEKTN